MSDFLETILAHKRTEIEEASRTVLESTLRIEAEKRNAKRSLLEKLSAPGPFGINVIAEIKRSSPSKGKIREDVDPPLQAGLYETGGAAAISVLTDGEFFGGSTRDLENVRAKVGIPVLRKDFIISSYQVYEAAAIGADALLLIVRALDPVLLKDLLVLCGELGMTALVEIHGEEELETATTAGAKLIGINNRDLRTFKTDIRTSIDLARRIQPGQAIVSESGIHGRAQIEELVDAGVFNFLIGESLMRSDDPVKLLRELHGVKP